MAEWFDTLTPTPVGGESLRVLLLEIGPEMEQVGMTLMSTKVHLRCKDVIEEAADPRSAQPGEVLVVPETALARLAQLPKGHGWDGARPVMAICPEASAGDLTAALNLADDALPWPEGKELLVPRLRRLAARALASKDAVQVKRQVGAVQELAVHLTSRVERELLHLEALDKIKTWVGGDRVMMLSIQDNDTLIKMADTDDRGACGLQLFMNDHPEVIRVKEEDKTLLYLGPQAEAGPDELSRCLGDGTVKAVLVIPLRWEGEVAGVLETWFDAEDRADAVNRTLLKRLAGVLAVSLSGGWSQEPKTGQTNVNRAIPADKLDQRSVMEQFGEYFQRTLDGILMLDAENRVMHLNEAGEQITGYSRVALQPRTLLDIVAEAGRPRVDRVLARLREDGDAPSFDLDLITTSGDPITIAVSPNAVIQEEGVVVLSFRDVTEARALEEDLRSTKEFLERLIDSTADGIIVTGTRGEIVLFNKGAERIFGLDPAEVRGAGLAAVMADPGLLKQFDDALAGRAGTEGRLEARRATIQDASGKEVPVSISASPIAGEGQEVGLVISIRDLSERVMMAESLAQAEEKLAETEKQVLIAELAGTTAHELNQPLTSIMGYAELLKRRMEEEDPNLRPVGIIMSEAERMADIVRKVGKITRYETKSYVGEANILDLDKASEEE